MNAEPDFEGRVRDFVGAAQNVLRCAAAAAVRLEDEHCKPTGRESDACVRQRPFGSLDADVHDYEQTRCGR